LIRHLAEGPDGPRSSCSATLPDRRPDGRRHRHSSNSPTPSRAKTAAWVLAAEYPRRFAAVAPVGGVTDPSLARPVVRSGVAVWAFHGDRDPLQPFPLAAALVAGLGSADPADPADDGGGPDRRVRFTRYEGAGHECWPQTDDNPRLYGWFPHHRRPVG
jgi:predicted peptidase